MYKHARFDQITQPVCFMNTVANQNESFIVLLCAACDSWCMHAVQVEQSRACCAGTEGDSQRHAAAGLHTASSNFFVVIGESFNVLQLSRLLS